MTAEFTDFTEVIADGNYPIAGDAMSVRRRKDIGTLWERVAESKPTREVPRPAGNLPGTLAEILGKEPDASAILAKELATQDYQLHFALVRARREKGLTQADVAEKLGITVREVAEFESYWNDPTMAEVRMYALVTNSVVRHSVSPA